MERAEVSDAPGGEQEPVHARVTPIGSLENLSQQEVDRLLKLGRSIRCDPATEKIAGDEEATRRAVPEYRFPWKFPAEYLAA